MTLLAYRAQTEVVIMKITAMGVKSGEVLIGDVNEELDAVVDDDED